MDLTGLLLACVIASFANGQWNRPIETGLGLFNGRQVQVDDHSGHRHEGRLFDSPRDFGPDIIGRRDQWSPGEFGRGFNRDRLRPCRALACTQEFIPARCRYTPVYQTAFGNNCLGCPEDICESRRRLRPRQRRRRRRLRRRLCREFGLCVGRRSGNPLGIAMP